MPKPFIPNNPAFRELWDHRWPLLTFNEMSCPCCGEIVHDPLFMSRLHRARVEARTPFGINSGHRCGNHNRDVGGAEESQHLHIAADISALDNNHRMKILTALDDAGFSTFGLANTYIHVDMRPDRFWTYGEESKKVWQEAFKEYLEERPLWEPKALRLRRFLQEIPGLVR